jgi:hypothetical protein
MVRTLLGKVVYDDAPESSTHCRGAFHPLVPPPSPPMPLVGLERLLAPLNAIVQKLAAIDERQAGQSQSHQQPQESSYFDFLATQPLKFAEATDPLEANHWLRVTEPKLGLLHYTELQKTLFALQQLCGSASAWWASYTAALPVDHHAPWDEFCTAFHAHHLPAGLLCSKLKEFWDLEQGNHTVYDYTRRFNTLAQYGSYHVDMDEKKANLYREGLTIHLQNRLAQFSNLSYNELVSAAIDQEKVMNAVAEADENKRKRMMPGCPGSGGSSGASPKYRIVYSPPSG